jgi:hypothetical protein
VDLTAEVVLSHKHPEDRAQVADTRGTARNVVVVGDLSCDDSGEVVGTHGFYVDMTPVSPRDVEDIVSATVAAIAQSRHRCTM